MRFRNPNTMLVVIAGAGSAIGNDDHRVAED
jgi:hypothetical protein